MRRTASVALAVVHASVVLVRHACVTAPCGDAQALATSDSSLTRSERIGGRCEFVRGGAMIDNGARVQDEMEQALAVHAVDVHLTQPSGCICLRCPGSWGRSPRFTGAMLNRR